MSQLITIAVKYNNSNDSFNLTKDFINSLELSSSNFVDRILNNKKGILSFETLFIKKGIYNLITMSEDIYTNVVSQLKFFYPNIIIQSTDDPILDLELSSYEFNLEKSAFKPILTFENFPGLDPMTQNYHNLINQQSDNDLTLLQLSISSKNGDWQDKLINDTSSFDDKLNALESENMIKNLVLDKISYPCFDCSLVVSSTTNKNQNIIEKLFDNLERQKSNRLIISSKKTLFSNQKQNVHLRSSKKGIVLNSSEIATLWHL